MAVQTTIMLAAIPWAMNVHGRMIAIEVTIKGFVPAAKLTAEADFKAHINECTKTFAQIKERLVRLEVKAQIEGVEQ